MKPAFLTRPEAWLRATRDGRSAVDLACAVERPRERGTTVGDVLFAVFIGIVGALALAHWWAA